MWPNPHICAVWGVIYHFSGLIITTWFVQDLACIDFSAPMTKSRGSFSEVKAFFLTELQFQNNQFSKHLRNTYSTFILHLGKRAKKISCLKKYLVPC